MKCKKCDSLLKTLGKTGFCNPCFMSELNKNKKGSNNHLWKDKDAGYITQHQWISRNYGNASRCTECGILNAKRYYWANISGEYKRDISDYKELCRSCHGKYDHFRIYGDKCRKGHPRLPENQRKTKSGKWKECPQCRADNNRRRNEVSKCN